MVVILKVGGRTDAADCIRTAIRQQGLNWRLVHVSTLEQARLALGRESVSLLLVHHSLPGGSGLDVQALARGVPIILTIVPGQEAVAAQALDRGFADYVHEDASPAFAALMLAQLRAAWRARQTQHTLDRQHRLLLAISRAQDSFIRTAHNRQAFELMLSELLALTDSAYGFLGEVLYDAPDRPWINVHALSDIAWDEASRQAYKAAGVSGMPFRNLNTLFGAALVSGEAVLSNQPATDPRSGGVPKGHMPMHSFLGLPVGPKGALLAVVGLANKPGGYAQEDIDFLKPLLDTIGQMVEARRADQRREQTLQTLETTLDSISQGLSMVDAQGRCVLFNRRALELLGLPAERVAHQPHHHEVMAWQRERGEFDGDRVSDPQVRAYLNNPSATIGLPTVYQRRTLDDRVLEVRARQLPDGGLVRTYTDVTGFVQSQAALQAARERLAAIIEGTRAGTWEWHIQTDEVVINERFASLVGYEVHELPSQVRALYDLLLNPADEDRLAQANALHLSGQADHYECQFRFKHKRGHWVWLLERGRINTRGPQGEPLVMSGTSIDISHSKHAEEALRVTSELLRERTMALETTLQAMSQGILVVGPDGRVRLYNQRACAMLDLPDTMMAELPLLSDLTQFQTQRGDFGPAFSLADPHVRSYLSEGSSTVDASVPRSYTRRTAKGRVLEIKSEPLPGGGFVRTFADVTSHAETLDAARQSGEEVRRLNETLELRVAQRTAELERSMHDIEALSYSIAHDLRGPLRAVNGFAALIAAEEASRLSPEGREMFGRITEASRRMGTMITDLLELFKVVRAELHPVAVDLSALAQEAVRSLACSFPGTGVVVEPMPLARGDATLLRHLMFNLVDNALKYSAKSQAPRVTVGWSPSHEAWFVRDNGVGFDMAHADQLFGLFRRLHSPADFEGSGVGLAVVARIVERHGGRIWAEARPGLGATFWFNLGAHPAPHPP